MNTPAHLIFGVGAFARPGQRAVCLAAVAGSLLPDLSLYVLAGFELFILGIPPSVVFGQSYYSALWQQIFAVDNSVFVWAIPVLAGLVLRRNWLTVFGFAGLLHLALDFPLHHDDGRQHFWPLSDWIFRSPVSYWDPAHYGQIVGVIEVTAALVVCAILIWRFRSLIARLAIVALAVLEAFPLFMYIF